MREITVALVYGLSSWERREVASSVYKTTMIKLFEESSIERWLLLCIVQTKRLWISRIMAA
jgi:hypothetical protein